LPSGTFNKQDISSGARKSAIILGILEKENAQEVMKQLNESQRVELSRAIANLEVKDFEEVEEAITEFVAILKGDATGFVEAGLERVIAILEDIVSEDEKERILSDIFYNKKPNLLTSLQNIKDITPLTTMVSNEESPFIALLATYMKPNAAAKLLSALPPEKQTPVAEGVSLMGRPNAGLLERIEARLSEKIKGFSFSEGSIETDGVQNLVAIINNVSRTVERSIFDEMDKTNPELAEKIRENLFVFEDIVILDPLSIQRVFSTITDTKMIALALKTATNEVKNIIYSSIPEQRRELLDEELDSLGPIQRSESEEAQQEIANTIKRMEKNNEIVIDRGGDDVIY